MTRKLWFMVPLAALIALSALTFACGDDDDDTSADDDEATATPALSDEQQAAADYMDSLVELFNGGDIEAFLEEFTEAGLRAFLQDEETPIEDLKAQALEFLGGDQVENPDYNEIVATADSATVSMTSAMGRTINAEQFDLVKDGDAFKVDGYVDLPEELPANGVLDVAGVDFGYEFDGASAEDGVEAIAFTNGGEQFHEIALLKAAEDSPELDTIVEEALAAAGPDDLPDSVEEFLGIVFAAPGESSNMVLSSELEAGRYVMVCFIPDETQGEEGPPHATLGMSAEFTVQ